MGRFTGPGSSADTSGIDDPPIKPVYPIETILGGFAASEAVGATRAILGLGEEATGSLSGAVSAIEDYLGGRPDKAFSNAAGDTILMRGDQKIRFDINNSHGYDPHFHIETQGANGDWNDAGDQHMYFFNGEE